MSRKGMYAAVALTAVIWSGWADAAPAAPRTENAAALFGARPLVEQIDLSPDGRRVVYITPGPGRSSIAMVADVEGGNQPTMVLHTKGHPDTLRWCRFAGDEQLVCQIAGVVMQVDLLVPFTRLLTLKIDGSGQSMLGQKQSLYDARLRQFDGTILDWLPRDDGAILMARTYIPEAGKAGTRIVRSEDGLGVDRIDLGTLRTTRIEPADRNASFFITDGRGEVRIKATHLTEGQGQLTGRWLHQYRLPGSRTWLPFSTWNSDGDGMWPLDVNATTNSAYVLKKLDGRTALYQVALDQGLATELVYSNPRVDVDNVVRAGPGSGVIGVTFAEEKRHVIYFDTQYQALASALGKAIPHLPMIDFVATDRDGQKLLIHAGSDSDPGRYYLYDRSARNLNEILLVRPDLEDVALATVRPISYPARDGTAIPGYLTLPPGTGDAKGLPGIVLPHGGPSARDEWGFDWLAQFLAHQGYAVLQPNFRGSSGFGDAWQQENGFQGWQTSIGDISDAGRWLLNQGIVAPGKLAIVGWSYGGYAALQTGSVEPALFQAIVAIAPVTDLELLRHDADNYNTRRMVSREIGRGAHILQGSPLRNAERISAPVLMFHGSHDLNVSIQHARRMDAKLRAAGKSSELVVYDELEHALAEGDARSDMLRRIDAFLHTAIATP